MDKIKRAKCLNCIYVVLFVLLHVEQKYIEAIQDDQLAVHYSPDGNAWLCSIHPKRNEAHLKFALAKNILYTLCVYELKFYAANLILIFPNRNSILKLS